MNHLWQFNAWNSNHVSCVMDPLGSGQIVTRYAIPYTDSVGNSSPRGDTFGAFRFGAGMDKYISLPMYIPTTTTQTGAGNVPMPSSCGSSGPTFFLFAQLEVPGSVPPPRLSINCANSSGVPHLSIQCCNNSGNVVWMGPALRSTSGGWHTLIMHTHWESSYGGTDGKLQAWFDGVPQTMANGTHTQTGMEFLQYPYYNYDYLDLASYRSASTANACPGSNFMCGTYTIYHGESAIGPTYASVYSTLKNPPRGP
jgi:hypothetical protein